MQNGMFQFNLCPLNEICYLKPHLLFKVELRSEG